ncbi:MAG: DUF4412 domain-containing protein [Thermovirgaceae bacterium]|nr:DUF4412 domain-containing protein [Thermovirgaceae bacterium]
MKKFVFFAMVIGFCAMLSASSINAEGTTVQYSATETISTERGDVEARIFVAPGMKRMEMSEATQILRFDKGVIWVLMPQQRMYMERSIASAPEGGGTLKYLEKENLGKETVNGIAATKYKTVAEDPQGNRLQGFSWFTDDGILVKNDMKVQSGGRSAQVKSEISDLKVERQDPSLFEIPQGFNKLAMPAGMPGGMPGGMKIPGR